MKKLLTTFLLFCTINTFAFAVEFDSSIDATIRNDYNVETNELPPLPNSVPSVNPVKTEVEEKTTYNPTGKVYTIKSGTKVNLVSQNNISDWMGKGSRVSFKAREGFTTKEGAIIPAGTIFKGTITDAHRPQMTGNGGLVELKIDEIYYNGVMSKIETKVSLANSKKVFLGNIKGKRSYWKNFSKVMTPGNKVFSATRSASSAMFYVPFVNLFSWAPITAGSAVYLVNLVAAPVITIFYKGGTLSLPAGTVFQIKITESSKIKG